MRFLASIGIATALLGGVGWCQYLLTRSLDFDVTREAHTHTEPAEQEQSHAYRFEIVTSFAAAHDPFALRIDETGGEVRLLVRSGERVLLEQTEDIQRGQLVTSPDLRFAGREVSLYVEASPTAQDARHPCALRLRVYRDDGALCDEVTIWSGGGGEKVGGTISCSLEPKLNSVDRGLAEEAQ